jgi:hypothetical protein
MTTTERRINNRRLRRALAWLIGQLARDFRALVKELP